MNTSDTSAKTIEVIRIPEPISFPDAYDLQVQRRAAIQSGDATNALFMLEHTPTFTLGRNSSIEHLLVTPDFLKSQGIEVEHIDRGGDITYHGPGQLVAYPILNLEHWTKSIHWYLRTLEEVIIDVLTQYGIQSTRIEDLTGVWVDGAKIAAVGVGIHKWVTFHGISINLDPDMEHWNMIVPCGIPDKPVTSLSTLLPTPPTMPELMDTFERAFIKGFTIS
jgi:lipoate-protein ligase B